MSMEFHSDKLTTELRKLPASRHIIPASFPPTPPPETETATHGPSITYPRDSGRLSPIEPSPIVAVIGVGYVGTHLVEAFAHHYNVLAFDLSEQRLQLVSQQLGGPIRFTSCAAHISEASHILISVPTVLKSDKTIDTTYLRSAIATVERYGKPGSTIVIESSVAVGMTRQLVGPLMTTKNFKVGMSPERVDPGRTFPAFENIPKVVSGLDAASLLAISELYGRVFQNLLPVSSPEVAEMTKLYENCQRMVCAAYANEMADACNAMGIDAWEVSEAAASKPFGYLPFRPGPGIGGHCIPVNPYYLLSTCSMPLLEYATTTSWDRPTQVAKRFAQALLQMNHTVFTISERSARQRVLVVGVGFKRGQSVMSNSPGEAIIRALLSDFDMYVEFADPLVRAEALNYVPKMDTTTDWNEEYLSTFDGIVVAVNQVGLDLSLLEQLPEVMVHDYSGTQRNPISVYSTMQQSEAVLSKEC